MFQHIQAQWQGFRNYLASIQAEKFFEVCRWFNVQLTTAFGILTTVHWSTLLFGFIILLLSGQDALLFYTIGMLSVIPHEYGHALAARRFGIKTSRILLYPIGGVAMLTGLGKKWYHETIIALAGPAVSFGLGLIGLLGMWVAGPRVFPNGMVAFDTRDLWFALFTINMILTVFNMIPAFPMDGGRVLRSLLESFLGKVRATEISHIISIVMCGLMMLIGLILGSFSLILISMLIIFLSKQEKLQVQALAAEDVEKNKN